MRLPCPATFACTGRRLTFQRRLVTLWAWLMRFPACGFLPQISHCCAITDPDPLGSSLQTYILQQKTRFRQFKSPMGYCYSLNLTPESPDDYSYDGAADSPHADNRSIGFRDERVWNAQ